MLIRMNKLKLTIPIIYNIVYYFLQVFKKHKNLIIKVN